MRMRLAFCLSLCLGLIGALTSIWSNARSEDPATRPKKTIAADAVDEPVEPPIASVERAIRFYEKRIEKNPKIALNYIYLAQHYVRKAKDHGDEACYPLAEAALREALKLRPDDPAALLPLASVLCSRHQFREGMASAKKVYEKDPSNVDALAIVGDAQMELGEYDEAEASFQKIESQVKVAAPGLWVRQAQLAEIKGKTDEALDLLQRAEKEILKAQGDQPLTLGAAWYQVRLGHFYLDHGRTDEANREFEAAVAALPEYFLALAGLAEVHAAQGRYEESIAVYRRTIAVAPDPIFFMAIGDIQAKLGHADEAIKEYDQAEKLILESNASPAEYSRELSLFYSQRNLKPQRALELAKTDFTFRQDIHAHDTLALALYRNEQFAEAAEAIEQALRWGTKEARLHYHAGMIRHRLGQADRAKAHLEQALAINPQFSVLDAADARRLLAELSK